MAGLTFKLQRSEIPCLRMKPTCSPPMAGLLHLLSILLILSPNAAASGDGGVLPAKPSSNPFTEKAALLRYWNRKVPNKSPRPPFLVSKLTPLSAAAAAKFSNLAAINPFELSSSLPSFCSSAGLLCFTELVPSLASHPDNSNFSSYETTNFTNYGPHAAGGLSSFKSYVGAHPPYNTFSRYAHESAGHEDKFKNYGVPIALTVAPNFTSYGTLAAGGLDDFTSYAVDSNNPELNFKHYSSSSASRALDFTLYSNDANFGEQSFSGYAKIGTSTTTDFTSYADNSNVISSGFTGYGEEGNGNKETFSSYGEHGNIPENNFKLYGSGTLAGIDKFSNYRDHSNIGDDSFSNYEKNGNNGAAEFTNYGVNDTRGTGSDTFKTYGEGSGTDHVTFKTYFDDNTAFKTYAKKGIEFKTYLNSTKKTEKQSGVKLWVVEAGKFFRESALKKGTVMPMPDIRDQMLPRSFLPRSIAGKIPFSSDAVSGIFKLPPETGMAKAVASTVGECERPPSRGETKRCITSAEDMIDFAVSVLGGDIAVRSTDDCKGSKGDILIGEVRGVDGGKVTESVSCHQSLFPYLVYYCHSVPNVRVYEAEILAVDTKKKINQGVAICHLDTSEWSPTHGAFVALGLGPGKIEVCHWIFQGDMMWTIGD